MIRAGDGPIKKGPTPFEEPGIDKAWYKPEFSFDDWFIPFDYKLWGATSPAELVEVKPKIEILAPVPRPIVAPVAAPVFAPAPAVRPTGPVIQQRLPQRPIVLRP